MCIVWNSWCFMIPPCPTMSHDIPTIFDCRNASETAKMWQVLVAVDVIKSESVEVEKSTSRQVVAWDLHSHLLLEKSNGIEKLLLFYFSPNVSVTVSHASGSRSCFIILHHAAYVKSCEDIHVKMFARHEVSKKIGSETRLVQTRKIYYIHNSWKPKPIKNAEVDTDLQRKPITWITHISCRFSWNRSRRMLFAQRESDTTGTKMVALVKHSIWLPHFLPVFCPNVIQLSKFHPVFIFMLHFASWRTVRGLSTAGLAGCDEKGNLFSPRFARWDARNPRNPQQKDPGHACDEFDPPISWSWLAHQKFCHNIGSQLHTLALPYCLRYVWKKRDRAAVSRQLTILASTKSHRTFCSVLILVSPFRLRFFLFLPVVWKLPAGAGRQTCNTAKRQWSSIGRGQKQLGAANSRNCQSIGFVSKVTLST